MHETGETRVLLTLLCKVSTKSKAVIHGTRAFAQV